MNFSFIWKASTFSKWLLSRLEQKTSQELVFKAVKNRKRRVWLIASRSDRLTKILQDKVSLFETMMTTTNEVNRDKTKIPDWFFFVMFACLFYCWTRWVNWFTVDVHVSLFFNPLISVVQLWNYTKTIIPLTRLSEYCRIIPSTSSQGLFDNIHFAFGE